MPWFSSQIHLHEQNHRSYVDVQPRLKITSLKRDTALEPEAGSLNDSEAPGTKRVFLLRSKIKAGLNYTCIVLYVKPSISITHSNFLDICLISLCHICYESLVV